MPGTLRRPALSFLSALLVGTSLTALTLAGTASPAAAGDPLTDVKINEVESNLGTPGDWVELRNNGATPTDVSGLKFKDADDTHAFYEIPAGTSIPAGGYLVLEEAQFGFGLGAGDTARLFQNDGLTLIDSFGWSAHAAATYGRCPDGTGAFGQTVSTKGAANDCPPVGIHAIRFNEAESNGDPIGDWAELTNISPDPVDVSGLKFKDADDTHAFYAIPAGTTIAPGGFFVLDEADFGFGLGNVESVRLFTSGEALLTSYSWTEHAATTYGRCPDGTGAFTTTAASTKEPRTTALRSSGSTRSRPREGRRPTGWSSSTTAPAPRTSPDGRQGLRRRPQLRHPLGHHGSRRGLPGHRAGGPRLRAATRTTPRGCSQPTAPPSTTHTPGPCIRPRRTGAAPTAPVLSPRPRSSPRER